MKKNKVKQKFLDELKRIPIIQVASEKCGISRTSIYRWREKDKKFSDEMDTALAEGEALVNDLTEAQLLNMIKEKEWCAISFWLRHRNPKFRERVEITTKVIDETLSPEQDAIVREALRLGTLKNEGIKNNNQNQNELHANNSTGTGGDNDKGQESKDSNNKI